MSTKPPVSAEEVAESFESLAPATDRVRLAGLDHGRRVQAGRIGATRRRLALAQARRPSDTGAIARLEQGLDTERRVDGAYERSVTRAEIELPDRKTTNAIIHGLVFGVDGAPASGLTVATVDSRGAVERFTCTDAKGYFRMDLERSDSDEKDMSKPVFLQVSDDDQAVLYRGAEAIVAGQGSVAYREIRLGGERLPPCPIPPDRATMPRLLDLPESEALALLGRFGLGVGQRLTQEAPRRAGLVVSQEPAAGTPISAETKVTLVIGVEDGADLVAVPDLVGLSRDEAQSKLAKAKLALGAISELAGSPPGSVLRHKPVAGTQVAPGTAVDLVIAVATPAEGVEVPDLVGKSAKDAAGILKEAGLKTGRVSFVDGAPADIVVAHDPKAGERVAKDTVVDLEVGRERGSERVDTPNVLGRSLAEASAVLESARLKPGEITGARDGTVAEQKPKAGTAIAAGSAVSLRLEKATTPLRESDRFADDVARQIAAADGFATLSVSEASVRQNLVKAGVTDTGKGERVVKQDNAALRRTFGLRNLSHARSLRRMLREALEKMQGFKE